MFSFRRLALLLALGLPAVHFLQAQSSSSSSVPATPTSDQAQQPDAQTQAGLSVQARIRARREQRRAAAIHEIYDHRYEGYLGAGYLRFRPGTTLQRVNEYNWNGGFTRYFDERLGVTLDGRGYSLCGAKYLRCHKAGHQPVLCAPWAHLPFLSAAEIFHLRPSHGRIRARKLLRGYKRNRGSEPWIVPGWINVRRKRQCSRGVQRGAKSRGPYCA